MKKFPILKFFTLNEIGEYVMGLPTTISSLVFTKDGKSIDEKFKEYDEKKNFEEFSGTLGPIWTKVDGIFIQTIEISDVDLSANGFAIISISPNASQIQYESARDADLRIVSSEGNKITVASFGYQPNVSIPVVLKVFYK